MTLTCLEHGEDIERRGPRQSVFNQNEIEVRLSCLPEPLIEVPAGLDPIATATQVYSHDFPELHIRINDLHTRCCESAHLVHVTMEVVWHVPLST